MFKLFSAILFLVIITTCESVNVKKILGDSPSPTQKDYQTESSGLVYGSVASVHSCWDNWKNVNTINDWIYYCIKPGVRYYLIHNKIQVIKEFVEPTVGPVFAMGTAIASTFGINYILDTAEGISLEYPGEYNQEYTDT
jgi:hypothetical protein